MENIIELLIGFRDKAVVTRGFLDTGNNLYDRVTGKPIVVAAPDIIKKLYSKTYGSILSFYFNGSTGEIKDLDNFQNRIHMIIFCFCTGSGLCGDVRAICVCVIL